MEQFVPSERTSLAPPVLGSVNAYHATHLREHSLPDVAVNCFPIVPLIFCPGFCIAKKI